MKTNGATWNAYLASWPEAQWFDDSDETINGMPGSEFAGDIAPDAVVEFTCGMVYATPDDREGVSLVTHFKRWLKANTHETVVVAIPKERRAEFDAFVKSLSA